VFVEFSLQDAAAHIEANLQDFSLSFSRLPGARSYRGPDVKWVYTGAPRLNRVLGARFSDDEADRCIDEILGRYAAWSTPASWFVGPKSRPADLGRRLLERGLAHRGDWVGMAADLTRAKIEASPPPTTEIVEVSAGKEARLWARTVGQGFGMAAGSAQAFEDVVGRLGAEAGESWRRYLLRRDGVPVATSSLFLCDGVAGLYYVATVPAARRQGLASAATVRALADAQALGYRVAILQATAAGAAVYRRLGFEEYCTVAIYEFRP
jgi:ribosomal protein S18 acetylase RimI-like enzyme